MVVLVTGGAGFIGSAVVRRLIGSHAAAVINVDKLTYAGNIESLGAAASAPDYQFVHGDICDAALVRDLFESYAPTAVLHLAAESHVDRSIDGPGEFMQTNIVGTFTLLQEALRYWEQLRGDERAAFRFVHISTDEVFGALGLDGFFSEDSPHRPNSPYAASKASADHLVRAWHHTYGLPVITTNCSNNYGPYQFPEKLIPLTILNALEGKRLPVYGRGENVRDWLYVDDHADALLRVLSQGRPGESYVIGGGSERRNLDVVTSICDVLDEMTPDGRIGPRRALIEFVSDRPGHDFRYAINASKIKRDLGWEPRQSFETGLRETVKWYLENREWWGRVRSGLYRGERLGLAVAV